MSACTEFIYPIEIMAMIVETLPTPVMRELVRALRLTHPRRYRYLHLHCKRLFRSDQTVSIPTLIDNMYGDDTVVMTATLVGDFCRFWGGDGRRCPLTIEMPIEGNIAASKPREGDPARRSKWTPNTSGKTRLCMTGRLVGAGFRVGVALFTTSFKVSPGVPALQTVVTGLPLGIVALRQDQRNTTNTRLVLGDVYPRLKKLEGPFASVACPPRSETAMLHACPALRHLDCSNKELKIPELPAGAPPLQTVKLTASEAFAVALTPGMQTLAAKCVQMTSTYATCLATGARQHTRWTGRAGRPAIECDKLHLVNVFATILPSLSPAGPAGPAGSAAIVAGSVEIEGAGRGSKTITLMLVDSLPSMLDLSAVHTLALVTIDTPSSNWTPVDALAALLPNLIEYSVVRCRHSQGGWRAAQVVHAVPPTVKEFTFEAETAMELVLDIYTLDSQIVHGNLRKLTVRLGDGDGGAAAAVRKHEWPESYVPWTADCRGLEELDLTGIDVRLASDARPPNLKQLRLNDASISTLSGEPLWVPGVALQLEGHLARAALPMVATASQDPAATVRCDCTAVAAACAAAAVQPSVLTAAGIENVLLPAACAELLPYVRLLACAAHGDAQKARQADVDNVPGTFARAIMGRMPYMFSDIVMVDPATLERHPALTMFGRGADGGASFRSQLPCHLFGWQAIDAFAKGVSATSAQQPFDPTAKNAPVTAVLAPTLWVDKPPAAGSALAALAAHAVRRIAVGPDAAAKTLAQEGGVVVVHAGVQDPAADFGRPGLVTSPALTVAAADFAAAAAALDLTGKGVRHVQMPHAKPATPPHVLLALYAAQLATIASRGMN